MFIEGNLEPFACFCAVEVRSEFGFYNIKRLKSGRTSTVHDVASSIIVSPWLQTRIDGCFLYSFSGVASASAYFLVLANLHLQLENDWPVGFQIRCKSYSDPFNIRPMSHIDNILIICIMCTSASCWPKFLFTCKLKLARNAGCMCETQEARANFGWGRPL